MSPLSSGYMHTHWEEVGVMRKGGCEEIKQVEGRDIGECLGLGFCSHGVVCKAVRRGDKGSCGLKVRGGEEDGSRDRFWSNARTKGGTGVDESMA